MDKIYPPGQLADKLKASYRYLSKLPVRGVVQVISCSLMISMLQPSVVIVALNSHRIPLPAVIKSPLGRTFRLVKLGIVFHTDSGSTLDTMDSSFGANVPGDADVFVASKFSNTLVVLCDSPDRLSTMHSSIVQRFSSVIL